jgi:hypothetical protein
MVVMDSLHVILQVPLAGKAVPDDATLTAFIVAKERLVTMAMEAVGLSLVAEKASRGRKPSTFTRICLATIWLQVRVDKFATKVSKLVKTWGVKWKIIVLTHNCT